MRQPRPAASPLTTALRRRRSFYTSCLMAARMFLDSARSRSRTLVTRQGAGRHLWQQTLRRMSTAPKSGRRGRGSAGTVGLDCKVWSRCRVLSAWQAAQHLRPQTWRWGLCRKSGSWLGATLEALPLQTRSLQRLSQPRLAASEAARRMSGSLAELLTRAVARDGGGGSRRRRARSEQGEKLDLQGRLEANCNMGAVTVCAACAKDGGLLGREFLSRGVWGSGAVFRGAGSRYGSRLVGWLGRS